MFDDAPVGIPTGGSATAWSGSEPLITPEPWMQDARCTEVDPEIFFPSKGEGTKAALARKVCGGCDVAEQCLAFAIRTGQKHGIWGGQSIASMPDVRRAA